MVVLVEERCDRMESRQKRKSSSYDPLTLASVRDLPVKNPYTRVGVIFQCFLVQIRGTSWRLTIVSVSRASSF